MHVIVMGVAATGKTTVGERLADDLGFEFVEGDSLHPRANIATMRAGVPLTDADRAVWLRSIALRVAQRDHSGVSTVVTCSALKRSYREQLRRGAHRAGSSMFFVHLSAPYEVLEGRMTQRTGHFMPTSLLRSQFDTLEPLETDEDGVAVDVSGSQDQVVAAAENAVRERFGL